MKNRLSHRTIEQLCDAVRCGVSVTEMCQSLGIARRTYYRWIARGRVETEGLYAQLVEAIDAAEAQYIDDLKATVYRSAVLGRETTTTRPIQDPQGRLIGTETVTIQVPPDADLALKILERKNPEEWQTKSSAAWHEDAARLGFTPDALIDLILKTLETLKAENTHKTSKQR